MAAGHEIRCSNCARTIEVWDEGHPYYLGRGGERVYAHHPDPERDFCTGIESDCMCLDCGHTMRQEVDQLLEPCAKCGGVNIVDVTALEGKECPLCRRAVFRIVEGSYRIS
jgi:DNA-directed RNA polymerase subunit RPC12/RpoP